jgi:hypothetical protein
MTITPYLVVGSFLITWRDRRFVIVTSSSRRCGVILSSDMFVFEVMELQLSSIVYAWRPCGLVGSAAGFPLSTSHEANQNLALFLEVLAKA